MFYNEKNDKYVNENTPFEIDGVQYPSNWLNLSSPEEKLNIGLVEVIATNNPKDDRFYWVNSQLIKDKLTYSNIPKNLQDIKDYWIGTISKLVYNRLQPSDYLAIKAIETGKPTPQIWLDWRNAMRTTASNTITAIAAATSVEQIEVLSAVEWPADPNTRPF